MRCVGYPLRNCLCTLQETEETPCDLKGKITHLTVNAVLNKLYTTFLIYQILGTLHMYIV